jgi:hypothetical protein
MAQIKLKQAGQPVADFSVAGALITVAGVIIDCAARQNDGAVSVEIRGSAAGAAEGGDGAYLAQIAIPARRYILVEAISAEDEGGMGQSISMQEPVPLDPNAIEITLWPTV